MKKLCGISPSTSPESGVDSVAAEPVYPAREIISAANEGNKSRGNDLFGVRSSADTVKGGISVQKDVL